MTPTPREREARDAVKEKTMNKEEVKMYLAASGMKKDYKAQWDPEDGRGVICFDTRGGFDIKDGVLRGTRIILDSGLITVWTSKVKKARVFTKSVGLKLRELTGECEFSAPASFGDEFLTVWGVKVKRTATEAQKARLAAYLKNQKQAPKTPSGVAQTA